MFELPELLTLAVQVNETLDGKVVRKGSLGNAPHKFVWYNRSPGEFEALTRGKKIGKAWVRGKWLFIPREPGYVLLLGECGARVLFHPPGAAVPKKFRLHLAFEDGSALTAMTQMWDELDLHNRRGGYVRIMDKNAVGRPCPQCRSKVEKIQYLGGVCYYCPGCQE